MILRQGFFASTAAVSAAVVVMSEYSVPLSGGQIGHLGSSSDRSTTLEVSLVLGNRIGNAVVVAGVLTLDKEHDQAVILQLRTPSTLA